MRPLYKILLLFLLVSLAACSDSEENEPTPEEKPNYPTCSFSQIGLTEIITSDMQPVTSTQTYLYNDEGRLTTYIGRQSVTAAGQLFEWADTTTVSYGDRQAVITESTGTVLTYTLNNRGYATSCTLQPPSGSPRTYTFTYYTNYDEGYFLKNISETISGAVYSSLDIEESATHSLRIVQRVENVEQGFTASTSADTPSANTSELPCLFLTETYPLSLHATAIYGKLLGEPLINLINQIVPDSDGTSTEIITYDYTLDGRGLVSTCQETIRHKEADSSEESYKRTIYYTLTLPDRP